MWGQAHVQEHMKQIWYVVEAFGIYDDKDVEKD